MQKTTKERLLAAINTVRPLADYNSEDYIFGEKHGIVAVDMVYILQKLSVDWGFAITDDFVDALDMCTFGRLEELLETHKI